MSGVCLSLRLECPTALSISAFAHRHINSSSHTLCRICAAILFKETQIQQDRNTWKELKDATQGRQLSAQERAPVSLLALLLKFIAQLATSLPARRRLLNRLNQRKSRARKKARKNQLKAQAEWLQCEIDALKLKLVGPGAETPLFTDHTALEKFFATGQLSWGQHHASLHSSDEEISAIYAASPQPVLSSSSASKTTARSAGGSDVRASTPQTPSSNTPEADSTQLEVDNSMDKPPSQDCSRNPAAPADADAGQSAPQAPPAAPAASVTAAAGNASDAQRRVFSSSVPLLPAQTAQPTFPRDLVPPVQPPRPNAGAASGGSSEEELGAAAQDSRSPSMQLSAALHVSVPEAVLNKLDEGPTHSGLPSAEQGSHTPSVLSHNRSIPWTGGRNANSGTGAASPHINMGAGTSAYSDRSERDGFLLSAGPGSSSLFDFEPGDKAGALPRLAKRRSPAGQTDTDSAAWANGIWSTPAHGGSASEVASSYQGPFQPVLSSEPPLGSSSRVPGMTAPQRK